MNKKLSIMENRMLRNFQERMVEEVVKHRDEKTIQWPDLKVSQLLEQAEYHLYEAKRDYLAGLFARAKKQSVHAANVLAMAHDNLRDVQ